MNIIFTHKKIARKPYLFILFLLFICFSLMPYQLFAQNESNISLNVKNESLVNVFNKLTKQSNIKFFYEQDIIENAPLITINSNNVTLQNVLNQISAQTKLYFNRNNNTISVSTKENKPSKTPRVISGIITDVNGEPIIGASIIVKNTTNGTITDTQGKYVLKNVSESSILSISYIGYKTQELYAKDKDIARIILHDDTEALDEIVVVGYGTQSRAKVTSAISKIEGSKLVGGLNVSSFDQALGGKLPGVNIQQANGAPGAGVNIKIRGNNSINYSGYPLIVVDGVPLSNNSFSTSAQGISDGYSTNPLSSINPSDIESIDVLKDAASSAIYGSRGSNGVIMITTKRGKAGKAKVNLNMYVGASKITKKVDVMDAYELANFTKLSRDLAWEAVGGNVNDPLDIRTGSNYKYPDYMVPYINGEKGLTNTDWQDEIYRTALQQNYDISINGGTEKMDYYVSGNYTDQEGIIINSGMKRYSVRTNINTNLTDKLKLGIRLNASQTDNNLVQSEANWFKEGIVILSLMYHPNLPVYNPDGSLATNLMIDEASKGVNVAGIQNPVALAKMVKNNLTNRTFNSNAFLEYNILDGLKAKTSFGYESIGMHRTYYRPKTLSISGENAPTKNYNTGEDNRSSMYNWISETSLTFNRDFGSHNIDALFNFSAQKEHSSISTLKGKNFPNDNVTTINAAATTSGSSYEQESAMISFLGRLMYSYKDKYMLTASLRRDGSSKFAANSKWGWFPSVSGGWNLSKETFYPKNAIANNLKIRASYGTTGNAEIPFYGGTAVLSSNNYIFGSNTDRDILLGFSPGNAPNKDLSWESTSTLNLGLDASFFRNLFRITLDIYQSETKDLLMNVTVPATSGFTSSLQNVGKVRNQGVEMMISTTQQFGKNWTWDSSLSLSTNKNKVLELAPGQEQILYSSGLSDASFIVKKGESLGSFYGYKINGIFKTQQEFDSTPHLENANQTVGDFIYADTNNDGKVNEADRVILGNANPDFTWGFNNTLHWKNFDFGFSLEGKHGQQVFNAMHRYLAETWGNNLSIYASDKAPRPVWAYGTRSHTRPSSWHVEDASFVRVRNISLGYTFNNFCGLNSLRIYASTTNPFTFTNYSGYNPEVSNGGNSAITAGEDFGNYPVSKSYIVGLNVAF